MIYLFRLIAVLRFWFVFCLIAGRFPFFWVVTRSCAMFRWAARRFEERLK